ncbi:MAG: alkaline phosphatase family protein [Firmicutes bacterium]|jgi:hypothetical protein|nr:alkaline phosphatase family protein [Bacillota bacterium]
MDGTAKSERVRLLTFTLVFAVVFSALPGHALAAGAAPEGAAGAAHAPYLIIHLDAVSSHTFFDEFDSGRLPHIARAFDGGTVVRNALSLFIGGTEMIYPRLKNGGVSEDPYPIAWETYDRSSQTSSRRLETARELYSYVPRYARSQFMHGLPVTEYLSGVAVLNVPRLLREYAFVEVFWFSTDTWGHVFGDEPQRASVRLLDRFLGEMMASLQGMPVNLILYGDHGMSFFERWVDTDGAVWEVAGDGIQFYSYPNLYLADPARSGEVARELAARDEVDFAFYWKDESTIAGWHEGGKVFFTKHASGVAYRFEGEDPFGYSLFGYRGEALSDQEWLDLTYQSSYPAAPVNLLRYMSNPQAGDVVVVVNPPKGLKTTAGLEGTHCGMADTDLMVPVLLKGPDLDGREVPDPMWLHTLYREVLEIDPRADGSPNREKHSIRLRAGLTTDGPRAVPEVTYSPARRFRANATGLPGDWEAFVEYDLYTSFNMRVWTGLGIEGGESGVNPIGTARVELFLDRLSLSVLAILSPEGHKTVSKLSYELDGGVSLEWTLPGEFGLSLSL